MSEPIKITMPLEQEGTKSVVRAWLKQIGEQVARDEPIVEIETDKVAVEVPAPDAGVLTEIALNAGDEAPPGAVLGLMQIGAASGEAKAAATSARQTQRTEPSGDGAQRLSPLVKRLVAEHKLDPAHIVGTGRDGRITHADVEAFIATRGKPAPSAVKSAPGNVQRIPHSPIRKSIAEHMAKSVATAPHVTAVFEADFSAVSAHRNAHKTAFERAGAPLTFSAYIVHACAEAMKVSPNVNSRWYDDHLEVFDDANIGIGVSLGDKGLIVPVIAGAQNLSLEQTARKLGELTDKARAGKLAPSDVQNGTFTISNHGVSGSLVATPIIINQPQSAILGVGKLEKRVVVREVGGADAMQIRPMAYVSLTIDHRVLDGHQTNAWLTRFVEVLETWPSEKTI